MEVVGMARTRPRKGDETVAANLLGMLDARGRPSAWLDEACGFGVGTVSRYLNREYSPALRHLRRMREALGCTWEELLD